MKEQRGDEAPATTQADLDALMDGVSGLVETETGQAWDWRAAVDAINAEYERAVAELEGMDDATVADAAAPGAIAEIPRPRAHDAHLLDAMLDDAAAYRSSTHYLDLLRFIVRMRRFSPFNALLLHRQKPGLSFAASPRDWRRRWKRIVKVDARPLVVLVPFGPVGFVYDMLDTEGLPGAPPLPRDAYAFPATGNVTKPALLAIVAAVEAKGIRVREVDEGDWHAGRILRSGDTYRLKVNRNHSRETRFTTIAHELGHLYLGHLGKDAKRRIPGRRHVSERWCEVEAESVAYLVGHRHGVAPVSDAYLAGFIEAGEPISRSLDVERVMRAAGAVEGVMGLAPRHFEPAKAVKP